MGRGDYFAPGIWIGSGTAAICLLTHGESVVRIFLIVLESVQEICFGLITGVK